MAFNENYPKIVKILVKNGTKLKPGYKNMNNLNCLEIAVIYKNEKLLREMIQSLNNSHKYKFEDYDIDSNIFSFAAEHLDARNTDFLYELLTVLYIYIIICQISYIQYRDMKNFVRIKHIT